MQGKFKTVTIIALAVLTLIGGVSCATGTGYTSSGNRAEIINVQGKDWTNANAEIPTTAIIQPEDLVISPVIDITTLKAETNTETASVRSSTLEQNVKKEAIKEALKTDPAADTELDEDFSGGFKTGGTVDTETGVTGKTSGQLATQAADNSFVYINSSTAFTGAIAEYDYLEGRIYEIITSPNAITDIRLKPGESIAASPIVNDGGTSWQFSMGTSVENGETVQHLFVKPTTVGLDTSMILLTDQRTYYFRIASFPKSYMTALRFRYPQATEDGYYVQEDFAQFIEEQAVIKSTSSSAYSIDLTTAEYSYTIRAVKGRPAWTPQQAFSDETKTYIQFPVSILNTSDMPSVYVVRDKEETLVNYRYIGNIIQLDTVITSNEYILLKSGQNEQVKITKAR